MSSGYLKPLTTTIRNGRIAQWNFEELRFRAKRLATGPGFKPRFSEKDNWKMSYEPYNWRKSSCSPARRRKNEPEDDGLERTLSVWRVLESAI
jgi:hypothetical protein